MNKLFTKIGVAFVGMAMAIGVGVAVGGRAQAREAKADTADDFISLANGEGTSGTGSQFTITSAGISFTFAKGYGNGTQIRSYEYSNNAVTLGVDATKVASISAITMTVGDSKLGGTWTGDCTYSLSTVTWTSTANGAAIKHTSQARFTAISVTYTPKAVEKGIQITGVEAGGLYLKGESYPIGYETTGFDTEPTITNVVWTVSENGGSISNGEWTCGSSAMENVTLSVALKANGTDYNASVTTKIDAVTKFSKNAPKTKFTTDEVFTVGSSFSVEYTYAEEGTVPETDAGISYRLENSGGTLIKNVVHNTTKFTTEDSGKYINATYKGVDLFQRYSITILEVFDNTAGAYYLVTDFNQLHDGDHVTLYGYYSTTGTTKKLVPTAFASNNVTAHTVDFDNDAIDGKQDFKILDFVLEDTSATLNNSFAFCVSNDATKLGQYLYAASSTSNYLRTQASIDANSRFAISIDSSTHVASISATDSTNRKVMSANGSSTIFSCYSGVQSNNKLYLYKWVSNANKVQEFIDDNMKMDQYTSDNTYDETRCNTNYGAAKEAFNSLTASQRALFVSEGRVGGDYETAYNRLVAWATSKHETIGTDGSGNENVLKASKYGFGTTTTVLSDNSTVLITIISLMSFVALGGFFMLKKKKEQ